MPASSLSCWVIFLARSLFVGLLVVLGVLLSRPAPAQYAQDSLAFDLEHVFDLEYAADPQISPSGDRVVYDRPYTSGTFSLASNGRIAYTRATPQRPADVSVAQAGQDPRVLIPQRRSLRSGETWERRAVHLRILVRRQDDRGLDRDAAEF